MCKAEQKEQEEECAESIRGAYGEYVGIRRPGGDGGRYAAESASQVFIYLFHRT
jgi:hypothetical protein